MALRPTNTIMNVPNQTEGAMGFNALSQSAVGNSRFKDLIKNNPYLSYTYNPTLWDRIGNFLNLNTYEDKLAFQMENQAKNYDSQMMQLFSEEQYNQEINSSQRMREAGLNPDLLGTSGASQASEFDNSVPFVPDTEGFDTSFNDVAGFLMNTLTAGMGFLEQFGSVSKSLYEGFGARDEYLSGFLNQLIGGIQDAHPDAHGFYITDEGTLGFSSDSFKGDNIVREQPLFNSQNPTRVDKFLQRTMRKHGDRILYNMKSRADYEESRSRAIKGRNDYVLQSAEYGGSINEALDIIDAFNSAYTDSMKSGRETEARNRSTISDNDVRIQEGTIGNLNEDIKLKQLEYEQSSFQKEFMKSLNDLADEGNVLAKFARLMFSGIMTVK